MILNMGMTRKTALLAASSMAITVVLSQSALGGDVGESSMAASSPASAQAFSAPTARKTSPYRAVNEVPSANAYYQSVWGVDNLLVRRTASDNLIRFSYRVKDAERAKALADKRVTPLMIGQRSRAVLQIPVMEKVGQLRQTGAPEAGKEYWMVFSNKGNLVKAGDRVDVVIGSFHVDGLIVE